MNSRYSGLLRQWSTISLLALVATLSLLLVTATGVLADQVRIFDKANVLNASQVQNEATTLGYPIDIYTINNFTGSTSAFDQDAIRNIASSRSLVIAIDTVHKHLAIDGGKSVPLSSGQYNSAVAGFVSSFRNSSDYTAATIAAVDSLKGSLGGGGNSSTGGGLLVGLLILLVIGVVIFFVVRGLFRRRGGVPYQQPYNQGYPPTYGPGYPPNYGQGQGINPWVAGGLGAAGGGFIGYELGKEAGEREAQQGQEGGNFGDGGNFGGGGSGDFGGGGGGDFGGGSGGDFGGGGGSDFGGGGGDFGGGGGGDSGGGSF